jgi:hypothetical protein
MVNLLCRLLGHKWVAAPEIRYEQGRTLGMNDGDTTLREMNVTWVCDEVCTRCGGETWWPT